MIFRAKNDNYFDFFLYLCSNQLIIIHFFEIIMLRKIRITLAAIMMVLVTLLFLDVSGVLHHYLAWTARIQFLPALLALNV